MENEASTMQAITSQLQDNRSRFLRRLNDNLDQIKVTTALQAFDELSFKEFCAELKKQKKHLTLSQQDEWEDYFNDRKAECKGLTTKIASTDNEINKNVYHLYGLTYDEVLTIDPDTKMTREEFRQSSELWK